MTTGRWDGRRSPNHEMDQKHPLEASAIPSGEVRLPAASGRAAIMPRLPVFVCWNSKEPPTGRKTGDVY